MLFHAADTSVLGGQCCACVIVLPTRHYQLVTVLCGAGYA